MIKSILLMMHTPQIQNARYISDYNEFFIYKSKQFLPHDVCRVDDTVLIYLISLSRVFVWVYLL